MEVESTEVLQTFQLMSDGKTLYWLYVLQAQETVTHPATGEKIKQHPLILQALELKVRSLLSGYRALTVLCLKGVHRGVSFFKCWAFITCIVDLLLKGVHRRASYYESVWGGVFGVVLGGGGGGGVQRCVEGSLPG